MKRNFSYALVVILLSGLQYGTVLKSEDPIGDTQTSPIKYEDKMKEVEGGEKGAPTPSFEFYKKQKFLSDPPMTEDAPEESPKGTLDGLVEPGEDAFEGFSWEEIDDGWWFDEEELGVKEKDDLDVFNDLGSE